jgi:hypothetical protein
VLIINQIQKINNEIIMLFESSLIPNAETVKKALTSIDEIAKC